MADNVAEAKPELMTPFRLGPNCRECIQRLALSGISLDCPAAALAAGTDRVNEVFAGLVEFAKANESLQEAVKPVQTAMIVTAIKKGVFYSMAGKKQATRTKMEEAAARCPGAVIMNPGDERRNHMRSR